MVDVQIILLIISIIVAVIAVAITGAYFGGVLDDILAPVVKFLFKQKAKAELKALQAQGLKAGQDFFEGEDITPSIS